MQDSRDFGETVLGAWPAWYFQIVLPAGFALIALQYFISAVSVWVHERQ